MSLISFLLIAAGGWIELAALCQAYGQVWAYNVCAGTDGLCNYHNTVFYGAIAVATAMLIVNGLRNT